LCGPRGTPFFAVNGYNQTFSAPIALLAMSSNGWFLQGHQAHVSLRGLSMTFDADQPAVGLVSPRVLDRPWSGGRLLGVCGSLPAAAGAALTDIHVRGDDLVAVYETGQPDAARYDLLWHAVGPSANDCWFARVDLLVSVRTDRLDWRYDVRLESVLPELTAAVPPAAGGYLFAHGDWCLAMMVHPADVGHQELCTALGPTAECRLLQQMFPTESLEKGVILRGRARAIFLPSHAEPAAVDACYAEFAAADPPLA
jgi:hypothetical protein